MLMLVVYCLESQNVLMASNNGATTTYLIFNGHAANGLQLMAAHPSSRHTFMIQVFAGIEDDFVLHDDLAAW